MRRVFLLAFFVMLAGCEARPDADLRTGLRGYAVFEDHIVVSYAVGDGVGTLANVTLGGIPLSSWHPVEGSLRLPRPWADGLLVVAALPGEGRGSAIWFVPSHGASRRVTPEGTSIVAYAPLFDGSFAVARATTEEAHWTLSNLAPPSSQLFIEHDGQSRQLGAGTYRYLDGLREVSAGRIGFMPGGKENALLVLDATTGTPVAEIPRGSPSLYGPLCHQDTGPDFVSQLTITKDGPWPYNLYRYDYATKERSFLVELPLGLDDLCLVNGVVYGQRPNSDCVCGDDELYAYGLDGKETLLFDGQHI